MYLKFDCETREEKSYVNEITYRARIDIPTYNVNNVYLTAIAIYIIQ